MRSFITLITLLAASGSLATPVDAGSRSVPVVHAGMLGGQPGDPALTIILAATAADDGAITSPPGPALAAAKERGLTISTSHVEYETDRRRTVLHEVSTDADLVGSVVSSRIRLDGAVLVVDALQGITADHSAIVRHASMLDVPIVAAWLDADHATDPAVVGAAESATADLLSLFSSPGTSTPIIRGSALGAWRGQPEDGDAVRVLIGILETSIEIPPRDIDKPFRMAVNGARTAGHRGTVATGRVETGLVRAGDEVDIVGMRADTGRAFILDGTRSVDDGVVASAGDRHPVGLDGVTAADLPAGTVLAAPGTLQAGTEVAALVQVDARARAGLAEGATVIVVARSAEVTAWISVADGRASIAAGEIGEVRVELIVPVAMDKGLRFAIREGGRTVGAGQVTEILR